jgi:cbb3-type cytochrome oxidase cytochrome c subunit
MQHKRIDTIIILMAMAFMAVAVVIMGLLPWLGREHVSTVTTVEGKVVEAQPYTPLEARGRKVYIREGCWYCHSQYVRPVTGEDRRWGPPSQEGEYAFDVPHMFGTRRIGPDLTREGGRVSDDWHFAHHFNPRSVVPDSIMPQFPWLFKGKDAAGRPIPTKDMIALVAYLQKLGTNLGSWRKYFNYMQTGASVPFVPPTIGEGLALGRNVYVRRCAGCHGESGGGDGPAAIFLTTKPRVFKDGVFKLRSTPTGSLPTDSDLYRTITMGIRDTAMPPWHELTESDRMFVVQYIKSFSDRFKDETPGAAIDIPAEPANSAESQARGKVLYEQLKCGQCHGEDGKGNGPSAPTLRDNWGNPSAARDFTRGGAVMKSGPAPQDLYRAFSTGMDGSPMPSYADSLRPEQRWDLVHYVMSFAPPDSYLILEKRQQGGH